MHAARRQCLHDAHGLQVGDEFILSLQVLTSMHSVRPKFHVTLPVTSKCVSLGVVVKRS